MSRITLGLAAIALVLLTACGANPGTAPPSPSPAPTTEAATATASASPEESATPTATPAGTATPSGTATPTGTATRTPAPGTEGTAPPTLPARVESFQRVEQRADGEVQVGSYYSESLKTVVEVRMVNVATAQELVTSLGGTNPTKVGAALCSTQGDTICAQESGGLATAVVSKELPASMVADLTTAFGNAAS